MKRFSMAMTWLAVAGLMTMVSCRKPVMGFTNGEARTVTVSAVTESGGGSKTSIDGLYVKWSEGDAISMNGCELTLEDECAGGTMGRFTGDVTGSGPYRIGYPAGKTTYDGETLKLNIPAELTYNVEKQEVPMVAYVANVDDDVYFRNAVNMLKLQLKGDGTAASKLKSIVLTSASSNLSGDIRVTFEGKTPTFNAITDGEGAGNTMTVNFSNGGLQLGNTVQCVYIPLAKINGGELTVRFNCANDKYMEKKVTVDANFNDVNNMLYDELTVNATLKEHGYVDLGLPNGTLWATCNVGADSPEGYGWYFMWGSVTEGGDPSCIWANCPGNGGSSSYDATAFNEWEADNLTGGVLNPDVDAATANWGGDWRMPTKEEWKALYDNNTFEWLATGATSKNVTSFKAVAAGYLVIKGQGSSLDPTVYLFLPAAGYRVGTRVDDSGSCGFYWSSSLYSSNPSNAYSVTFDSDHVTPQNRNYYRCYGLTVRPVR